MQHNKKKQFWRTCLLFVVIAYLPVISFQYAVKNDFFTAYFPLKKFLSTSLNAGSFPLWNPFLNYGFPVYGDMSEAWWNPLTWFIAAVPGYNVWTFTLELIAYLFIAFAGMYKLTGRWVSLVEWRLMAAAAYSASGFMVGHLQHFNWISAAALLPFCLYYLSSYTDGGRKTPFFLAALSLSFFATAAHPGLIIGFIIYGLFWQFLSSAPYQLTAIRTGRLTLLILLTCAGMIYGYAEVLPYTNRSAALAVIPSGEGSTTIHSWISFILPLGTTQGNFFGNDIALRNCYIGLLGFSLCVTYLLSPSANRNIRFHLILGAVFLFLSSNLVLPVFQHIPLLKFIRLNGELRIFAILSFVLAGAMQLQEIWNTDRVKKLLQTLWVLASILFVSCIIAGASAFPGWLSKWQLLPDVKSFLDSLSFSDMVFVQSIILLILTPVMIKSIQQKNRRALLRTVMIDLALACLVQLPFTGVGQRSVSDMGKIFAQAPSALKTPAAAPEASVVSRYPDATAVAGNWALVSQEIAQDGLIPYPLIFRTTVQYFDSALKDSFYQKPPFLIVSGGNHKAIEPVLFRYNFIRFDTRTSEAASMVIKQNQYPFWKASVNGSPVAIGDTAYTFMKIPLASGKNELEFQFSHPLIKVLLVFQFILMTIMIIMAYVHRKESIA